MTGHETDDPKAAKKALRQNMQARRRALQANVRTAAHTGLLTRLRDDPVWTDGGVVSGYWPLDDEFDIRPVLTLLADRDVTVGLPVVVATGQPLVFRRWTPDTRMSLDRFGISVPPSESEVVVPDVLLVPLLAFDREGRRLGYGGGFYDRTLAQLRSSPGAVLAFGVAYAMQQVPRVPHDRFDQPLDGVVTEKNTFRFEVARQGGNRPWE